MPTRKPGKSVQPKNAPTATIATIESEIISLYLRGLPETPPEWPPDVFAIACHLLKSSGAYFKVVENWPPEILGSTQSWADTMSALGHEWQTAEGSQPPKRVRSWWRQLISKRSSLLADIRDDRDLCDSLLQLLSAADEACLNFGIKGQDPSNIALAKAWNFLSTNDTLCHSIDCAKLRVLPKLRTPQTGLTSRSLSHHLALVEGSEIRANWWPAPIKYRDSLRLLLLPWPLEISKSQFEPVKCNLKNLPSEYGMFSYRTDPVPDLHIRLSQILDDAAAAIQAPLGMDQQLDGVILPELALTPEDFQLASEICAKRGVFLIGGVAVPAQPGSAFGINSVRTAIADPLGQIYSPNPQNKHHRWQLDKSQVEKYGLESALDPSKTWWEATQMDRRRLTFISMFDWLTMAVLICEDLARPDPVGDLIRSVGPNLVITLLMDAPQESYRWAARYAMALGDDPGSSVLTFTSLGMTKLAKGLPDGDEQKIAMWKDFRTGRPVNVNLPDGASGVVLYVRHEEKIEWTADGRNDRAATSYPVLKMEIPVGAGVPIQHPHKPGPV